MIDLSLSVFPSSSVFVVDDERKEKEGDDKAENDKESVSVKEGVEGELSGIDDIDWIQNEKVNDQNGAQNEGDDESIGNGIEEAKAVGDE